MDLWKVVAERQVRIRRGILHSPFPVSFTKASNSISCPIGVQSFFFFYIKPATLSLAEPQS